MTWKQLTTFIPLLIALLTMLMFAFFKHQNPKISINSGSQSAMLWLHDFCSIAYASAIYFYTAVLLVFVARYFWTLSDGLALSLPYLFVGILVVWALLTPPSGFLSFNGMDTYSIPGIMIHVRIDDVLTK